jgi:hypothetical protein
MFTGKILLVKSGKNILPSENYINMGNVSRKYEIL